MIIDSWIHAYEANTPNVPGAPVPNWPPSATGDEMVAAMDRVGVDGAKLFDRQAGGGEVDCRAISHQAKKPAFAGFFVCEHMQQEPSRLAVLFTRGRMAA